MPPTPEEERKLEETRMSLGEHLEELRSRLVKGLLAVAVAFVIAWIFRDPISELALQPHHKMIGMLNADIEARAAEEGIEPELIDPRPIQTGYAESFFFTLRLCLYAALFLGAPVLLWQLWQFVAAGLYKNERKTVTGYFPLSVLLFGSGVAFGFFVLLPYAFYFLASIASTDRVRTEIKIGEYVSMLSSLSLALGLVFQLPLLIQLLIRTEIVTPQTLVKYRAHFVVGACIGSAILTPPDPFTMGMMAIPTVALFELGILWGRWTLTRVKGRAVVPTG